jgi:predicted enzyme related to lactoylglutathione lyase
MTTPKTPPAGRQPIPGKFVWYELVATPKQAKQAQAFYAELLGWKVVPFPMGDASYDMIYAAETMIGGYAPARDESKRAHWLACVSVPDVDAGLKLAAANGGKQLEPVRDIPNAGRRAHIADPLGAELYLFRNPAGDPPDGDAGQGEFFWNELHTPDPAKAIAFYEKVVGYTTETLGVGPGDAYHVLNSAGSGRGGVTAHLPPGVPAHWLPYVRVSDPDATLARVPKLGGKVLVGPADIPDTGRFGVLEDPSGAMLAVMNPMPRQPH